MKRRILCLILCICMVLPVVTLAVSAEEMVVDVPITVDFVDATGVDLNIRLNPHLVETAELVGPSTSIKGASYAANQDDDKFKVAIASTKPIANQGVLFTLRLTLKEVAGNEDELCKLLQVKINEKITWQAADCVLLTGVKDGGIYNTDVTLFFNEGTATLNGSSFVNGTTVSKDGEYTLLVTDLTGRVRAISFVIDQTAPIINVESFDTNPAPAPLTVYASVNEGTLNATSYTFAENGSFTFVATDTAGNVTEKTVTVTHLYTDYTVALIGLPEQIQVTEGMEIDYSTWKVRVAYNNGVTVDCDVTPEMIQYDVTGAGTQQGSVTFGEKEIAFDYTVIPKKPIGIAVAKKPAKTEYLVSKDAFDPTGGRVEVFYNNGFSDEMDLSEVQILGFDNTKVGEQTLTVQYEDFETTLDIEIIDRMPISIAVSTAPNQLAYLENLEVFDPTGGKLTLYYDNDTTEEIALSRANVFGFDNTKVGKQTLTVRYAGQETTFEIEILENESVVLGDVDQSGLVDVADIMKLKALIMTEKCSNEELAVGDMDGSGRLDVGDIMGVKNIIMSK